MPHQITLEPSGHVFTAEDGETILNAALREGFALPYGCRNGACGSCKGKILKGEVDYGHYQANALKEEEKSEGKALFCRAKPLTDLVLEVREIGAVKDIHIRTLPCRVQKMERPADDVMVLQIKLPANERLQFLPGQYIDFLLKDGRRRSYSIANTPADSELLELHIRHLPGGHFSERVFKEMKEKDILRLEGPLGSFFMREDSDKPMIFVAGGTGFAPIKAMLLHAFAIGTQRPMVLYWGVRSRKDLYMGDLAAAWQQEHSNFSFIPVLSAPFPDDAWIGRTGYVHDAVLADFKDLSGYQVYVCGAPAMVEAAQQSFTATRGLPEEEFYADSFVNAAATEEA